MERLRVIPFAIAAAVLAVPIPALAAPSEKTPLNLGDDQRVEAAAGGSGGSIMRTLVGLVVVVGVIYALQFILKQTKASKEGKVSGLGLAAVASLPVGGGRSVQLVRAGREYVLVGIAEQGVSALRHYSEDEASELGLLPPESPDAEPRKSWLDRLREKTVIR
jgi:flagellar protein FliO/FliZ